MRPWQISLLTATCSAVSASALCDPGAVRLQSIGGNYATASLARNLNGQRPLRAVFLGARLGALVVCEPSRFLPCMSIALYPGVIDRG